MKPPQGPVAPGTVFAARLTMMGRTVEVTATIRALRPPTGYDYEATSEGLNGSDTMTLRDLGGGSVKFHVHIEMRPTTVAMSTLFACKFRATERARLARMKEMLESGTLVPPA